MAFTSFALIRFVEVTHFFATLFWRFCSTLLSMKLTERDWWRTTYQKPHPRYVEPSPHLVPPVAPIRPTAYHKQDAHVYQPANARSGIYDQENDEGPNAQRKVRECLGSWIRKTSSDGDWCQRSREDCCQIMYAVIAVVIEWCLRRGSEKSSDSTEAMSGQSR